ncbi:MAG: 5-formyltetrahydrofolate cyclo-ligase [Alphaproteobacteria bacterium]|nr:5-formyltetrahydrofolate cyclo-ligase [Alphaproteobacteria bacterium]
MTESKASIRLRLRKLRDSVHAARGEEAAQRLQDHLVPRLVHVKDLAQDRLTPSHPGDTELNVNPSLKQISRADSRHQSKPFNGFDFRRPALVVAGYWPMGSEMDPRPLMMSLQDQGARLALPVVTARNEALSFRAFSFADALKPGLCGSLEPTPDQPLLTPSLLLVPLLGFDRKGCRLGQGGGFYDRTLASLRKSRQLQAIGIAYAAQEVASLPCQAHDQKLDAIATEEGFIEI